jgi:hypothetical protein
MPDQPTNTGAPAAPAPALNPAPRPPEPTRSTMVENPRARGHSPAIDARAQQAQSPPQSQPQPQPQQPPPETIRIGDAEYAAADVHAAMAERAEAQVRKSGLPSAPEGYEVKNSANFQLPEGVKFQFDLKSPELATARKFALANNLTQEQFSGMLDLYVATQVGGLTNQQRLRDANLQQLGAAAPQRIEAVSTWLAARAGKEGQAMANMLRQFPAVALVKGFETLIRQFSSQGGVDFSQQHREAANTEAGKIAGYENMNFQQRRAAQMAERMKNDPNYARGQRASNEQTKESSHGLGD